MVAIANVCIKADELKEAMKESPRRYTNPFLSDDEDEKVNFWNNQELQHLNINDDLTNNREDDEFRNSLASCNVPSDFCEKETELYTDKNVLECELPELLVCYKEGTFHVKDICIDEGIPHGERILFDDNNNEILKPERYRFPPMEVEDYYMESSLCSGTNGKNDTDMPILESTNDHMHIEDNQDKVIERKSDASSGTQEVDADLTATGSIIDHCKTSNISIDTDIPNQDLQNFQPDKDCVDDAHKEHWTKEEAIDSVVPNEFKTLSKYESDDEDGTPECAPDKIIFSSESDTASKATEKYDPDINSSDNLLDNASTNIITDPASKATEKYDQDINSSDNLLDNASTKHIDSNSTPSLQQNRPLPSLKSLLESIDRPPCQSPVEEISKSTNISNESPMEQGNNTSTLNNVKSEASHSFHKVENPGQIHEHSVEPRGARKLQEAGSDNVAMVNQVNRGEGESSFSVAGPVSGLITYSGPIAYSGSISLRSDSSTTSTRSFAFPILPNEWNSSPVRMAKADRRRLQKHRGWRYGLLCCRF